MTPSDQQPPTTDRLRKDIDTGKTDDKVDYPDPAAAPLGTDDEAGGHSPTAEELSREKRHSARRTAAPPRRRLMPLGAVVVLVVVVAGLLFAVFSGLTG